MILKVFLYFPNQKVFVSLVSRNPFVCIAKYYFTSNGFGFHLNTPIYNSNK